MIKPTRKLCKWKDPGIIANKLIESFGENGLIWLDGDGSQIGRWVTLATDPVEQICSRGLPDNVEASNPFSILRSLKAGHWTGWLSYEAGAWIEPHNPWKKDNMATLWIARHDPILKFDLKEHKLWLEGCNKKRIDIFSKWLKDIDEETKKLDLSKYPQKINKNLGISLKQWEWITKTNQYTKSVKKIQELIVQGDMFQANLSACCIGEKPENMLASELFQRLRIQCPAPFAGIIVGDQEALGEAIISTSPERFLKVKPNGSVETRPIKGTRPRHTNPKKDSDLAAELICSQKDRAENIMIVDLLRNDLGKVCQPGTIHVNQLVGLESYANVHHLTSVITGKLDTGNTWIDLLEACWPGGSITGAPKLRACKRLNELEPIARGPYCGSFLHIDWNGEFDSNILIRSLIVKDSNIRVHAGCGIVADSDPNNEAEELKWKLLPLLRALE